MTQPPNDPLENPFDSDPPGTAHGHQAGSPGPTGYPGYPAPYANHHGQPAPMQSQIYGVLGGAGAWRRLAAYLLDMLVLAFLTGMVLGLLGDPAAVLDTTGAKTSEQDLVNDTVKGIIAFFYFSILHTTKFSTVGKRLLGIRVTRMDLQPIPFGASAIRSLWYLLPILPVFGEVLAFGVGLTIFIMAFMGDKSQGLDDKWARTRVMRRDATGY